MPAKSEKQRRLFAAAEHGATFKKAEELRKSMSQNQLHDFAQKTGFIRNTVDMAPPQRTRSAGTRSKGRY